MTEQNPTIQPALDAIERLRYEISKRIGKEGGNLNQRLLSDLSMLESFIRQFVNMNDVLNLLNQQTQVAQHGMRSMAKLLSSMQSKALPNGDDNGDDEESTKGK